PVGSAFERRPARISGEIVGTTVLEFISFNRDFALTVPAEPATVVVRFVNGNAVDPGTQAALLAKRADPPKYLQEHFLYNITSVVLTTEQPVDHPVDRLLILRGVPRRPPRSPTADRAKAWHRLRKVRRTGHQESKEYLKRRPT